MNITIFSGRGDDGGRWRQNKGLQMKNGFATEKNLGVRSKFRTHCLRLQVASTVKCGWREKVRFRECSLGHVKLLGTKLSVGSAPRTFYLAPVQLSSLKSHLFHIPSLSTALESSIEDCSANTATRLTSWDPAPSPAWF